MRTLLPSLVPPTAFARANAIDTSIHAELTRDDPARLLALFQAAARATFGEVESLEIDVVMDADVVEEM